MSKLLDFPETCPDTHEVQKRIMKAYEEHELSVDEMWQLVHNEHLYFVNQYKAMKEQAEKQLLNSDKEILRLNQLLDERESMLDDLLYE